MTRPFALLLTIALLSGQALAAFDCATVDLEGKTYELVGDPLRFLRIRAFLAFKASSTKRKGEGSLNPIYEVQTEMYLENDLVKKPYYRIQFLIGFKQLDEKCYSHWISTELQGYSIQVEVLKQTERGDLLLIGNFEDEDGRVEEVFWLVRS